MELNAEKLATLDFIPANLRTLIVQKGPLVLMYLLVAILAYQLAGFTWTVVERFFVQPAEQISMPVAKPLPGKQTRATSNYAHLGGLHLFGKRDQTKVVTQTPTTAPETRLALVLYGVFTDQDVKNGSAIIGPKSGKQEYYNVGDKVDTGVWLAEVRQDHVLLRRGASYETLKFPEPSTKGFSIEDHQAPGGTTDVSQNKQTFMDNVRIVPVFTGKDKTLKGYRILPKRNRAVYNRLGLRPSDIVTAINGIALNDQREAMKVINELIKSDQVEVELDRNGQVETRTLNLNQ